MISLEEALKQVRVRATRLAAEQVPLREAFRRVLAAPVRALRDLPATDISMMDGYALRAADAGSTLRVIGEVAAGNAPWTRELGPGEAARIFTGAPIPPGADSVVMQERCVRDGADLRVDEAVRAGQHLRHRGEELRADVEALPAGITLDAAQLALAGSCGAATVQVYRRPRVAVLATGDELVALGEEPGPGKIVETNSLSLSALCRDAGADCTLLGLAGDDIERIAGTLRAADADILVTTGGASVGDHDHTEDALRRLGGELIFHRVAIRPGKPILFGTTSRGQLVFGLPGNPAAASLGFELFVRLAVRLMQGDPQPDRPRARAVLKGSLKQVPGLTFFPRGRASVEGTGLTFTPGGQQSSMQIGSWASVNALAVVPPGDAKLSDGSEVEVLVVGAL